MMDVWVELLRKWMYAVVQLLTHPFLYIALLFLLLQYSRQIRLERKLFHARLHSLRGETWRAVGWGFIGGLTVSLVMMGLGGVSLTAGTVFLLWIISLLLIMVRVRFLCLAYSVGILGIAHAIFAFFPESIDWPWAGTVIGWIVNAEIPGLLAIVGLLHILEGLLVHWQGARMASPMFLSSKRGKIVGGYALQAFWPIPLFLLIPLTGGSSAELPWNPLFADQAMGMNWTLIGIPVMIGFSEMSITRLPKEKARQSSKALVAFGILILGLAIAANYWTPLVVVGSIMSIVVHEAIIWYSSRLEKQGTPMFVHDLRGLRILAVIPNGPAAQIGLEAGEIVHKVNGKRIHTRADLHEALRLNPAFCKLEVINLQGEIKFAQRALFEGDHHSLGIVLAPDQRADHYLHFHKTNLLTYVREKLKRGS